MAYFTIQVVLWEGYEEIHLLVLYFSPKTIPSHQNGFGSHMQIFEPDCVQPATTGMLHFWARRAKSLGTSWLAFYVFCDQF